MAAAITGSFMARMTSSSRSDFCASAASEGGRPVRPAARAAPIISAKPLAVRPESSDDMNKAFPKRRAQIAPVYSLGSFGKAGRFKAPSDPALAPESIDIVLDLGRERLQAVLCGR